ncbi:MAG: protein kinase [Candidatus Brocadiae bacterium]|nr:protein kinase [Candidatus Brocadiia bacterium]
MFLKQQKLLDYLTQKCKAKISEKILAFWEDEFCNVPLHQFLIQNRIFTRPEIDKILLHLEFDDPSQARLWSSLPNLHVIEKEAVGGMGFIYKVMDKKSHIYYALKLINTDMAYDDKSLLERFEREVEIVKSFSHPNIVKYVDSFFLGKKRCICFEWIDGPNLEQYIQMHGKMSEWQAVSILSEIVVAMCSYSARGILHRDIKPSNILLPVDGPPKLSDFGISRCNGIQKSALTRDFIGSPAFCSPEQIMESSDQLDIRSDIYSWGMTLYYCLAGNNPYSNTGSSRIDKMKTVGKTLNIDISGISEDMKELLRKTMAYAREDRFSSTAILGESIKKWKQWKFIPLTNNKESQPLLTDMYYDFRTEVEICPSGVILKYASDKTPPKRKFSLQKIRNEIRVSTKAAGSLSVNGHIIPASELFVLSCGDILECDQIKLKLERAIKNEATTKMWRVKVYDSLWQFGIFFSPEGLTMKELEPKDIPSVLPFGQEIPFEFFSDLIKNPKQEILVGRDPGEDQWCVWNDRFAGYASISRKVHAALRVENRMLYIQDRKSSGGTWINNEKLSEEWQQIAEPCEIKLGNFVLMLDIEKK